jgi:putative sporulation protein YtaF
MLAGQKVANHLPPQLASIVGGAIIAGIGAWVLAHAVCSTVVENKTTTSQSWFPGSLSKLLSVLDNPLSVDRDLSGHIDLKEVCLLAVALSLNNVGNGIGAGMAGISPASTTIAVMFFSVVTLWAGVTAGEFGQRMLGSFARVVSGVLLLAVGVYEIHL